ncbi:hypothetical protein T08_1727 [Trichinella sp. T8]|nr:hypothetical protein T08_7760 [Trichinella sp. T8]KRZ91742.1 hypothetical protein T08_1727 [Trichinella sp. T8]
MNRSTACGSMKPKCKDILVQQAGPSIINSTHLSAKLLFIWLTQKQYPSLSSRFPHLYSLQQCSMKYRRYKVQLRPSQNPSKASKAIAKLNTYHFFDAPLISNSKA